jgi:putative ABC transport system ATP-binding protein
MLEFKDVNLSVASKNIINDFSFTIECGQLMCLRGGHRSGKSLFLGAILGIWPIEKGFISFNGEPLTRLSVPYFRAMTAYMPQHFEMKDVKISELFDFFEGMNAIDEKRLSKRKLFDYWDFFGLEHVLIDKNSSEIMPSQLQIILLTLACLPQKELLLIDDPTSNLSKENCHKVASLLRQKASDGAMVIVASNDEAIHEVADEMIDMNNIKQQTL